MKIILHSIRLAIQKLTLSFVISSTNQNKIASPDPNKENYFYSFDLNWPLGRGPSGLGPGPFQNEWLQTIRCHNLSFSKYKAFHSV